jgi:Fe-S cluster assembly scaffold protein SufB
VDQEAIFYLQSRGVDRSSAEELLVEGFFRSVLAKLETPQVEHAVWQAIGHEVDAG